MTSAQIHSQEVKTFIRRRWKTIVLPCLLVTALCIFGAYSLPRKYESSTTILVRPDETLHPIQGYEMSLAFEEQLRNFNEILYSRTVVLALADSLGLATSSKTEAEKLAIVTDLSGNITTTRLGSDSFKIGFVDTNPARAQRAARILTDLFIQVKLSVANRQNTQTVEFYESKVQEYREGFDESVKSLVSTLKQNLDELPVESRALYSQIDEVERMITSNDSRLRILRESLNTLKTFPEFIRLHPGALGTESGTQRLLELQQEDLPFVSKLRYLAARYDSTARRFTPMFPEVTLLEDQIVEHLERMRVGIETEIAKQQTQEAIWEKRRSQLIEELKTSSTVARLNEDKQSNFELNRKMYDDMRMKLEQARLAQEVGSRGANQFIVLDPAFLPIRPTKPNRTMIVGGGLGFGLLLGILSAIVLELLDTTVRTPRDMQIYNKPIIALLPDGRER